jgi:hypothetical protein
LELGTNPAIPEKSQSGSEVQVECKESSSTCTIKSCTDGLVAQYMNLASLQVTGQGSNGLQWHA